MFRVFIVIILNIYRKLLYNNYFNIDDYIEIKKTDIEGGFKINQYYFML